MNRVIRAAIAALLLLLLASSLVPQPALAEGAWIPTGAPSYSRSFHTATLLADGRVLVAGGSSAALATAELYDPETGEWTVTGNLNTGRCYHSATLLSDGRVLIAGGVGESDFLDSAELYNPNTGQWSPTGSMNTIRASPGATRLPDGRVMVIGGYDADYVSLASTEIYDPNTGQWTVAASLYTPRAAFAFTPLLDGRVLVIGGSDLAGQSVRSVEMYDPSTDHWAFVASLGVPRSKHEATLLSDGRVLVTGGYNSEDGTLASAEIYDPATGQWTTAGDLFWAREYHSATLLRDGRVLVGGTSYSTELFDPSTGQFKAAAYYPQYGTWRVWTALADGRVLTAEGAAAFLFTPTDGNWELTGSPTWPRRLHTVTLLEDGRALAAGGMDDDNRYATAELYDPDTGLWSVTGSMNMMRAYHTATRLLDGRVLVVGGTTNLPAELYDPATGQWSFTGSLSTCRSFGQTQTLLLDGRVLVVGGRCTSPEVTSAEVYDPATGLWSSAGTLGTARESHAATLLPNGRVLVAGGQGRYGWLTSAELYDPILNLWWYTGEMSLARSGDFLILLPSGDVLAGGTTTEVYDVQNQTWTVGDSLPLWASHPILLPGGQILAPSSPSLLYDPALHTAEYTGSVVCGGGSPATLLKDGTVLLAGYYSEYVPVAERFTLPPPNSPPTAAGDSYTTPLDTPLVVPAPGVLANDSDADGDALSAILDVAPAHGTLALQAGGSFTYTPAPGFTGSDVFTYHAFDGENASNVAEVTITVTPPNQAPVAQDDSYEAVENTLLVVPLPGILANDTDPDGNPLTAVLDSPPDSGALDLQEDGSFTFMPATDFIGVVTFTYHAHDGEASSNIAEVTITVLPSAGPPLAFDDAYTMPMDTLLLVPAPGVLLNDVDPDGDPLTAMLDEAPPTGVFSLSSDGAFAYMPAAGFTGVITFTYHANDGSGDSNIATVRITVGADAYRVYLPLMMHEFP